MLLMVYQGDAVVPLRAYPYIIPCEYICPILSALWLITERFIRIIQHYVAATTAIAAGKQSGRMWVVKSRNSIKHLNCNQTHT